MGPGGGEGEVASSFSCLCICVAAPLICMQSQARSVLQHGFANACCCKSKQGWGNHAAVAGGVAHTHTHTHTEARSD